MKLITSTASSRIFSPLRKRIILQFLIEMQLIYSVLLISGVQQSGSVLYTF